MERFGGKQLTERVEDVRLLTGQGRYVDDLRIDGALHVVFVRSTYAHARLRGIDAEAARAMPGVRAIWTGADLANDGVEPLPVPALFKRPDGTPMATAPRRALALERVRYVGEPVVAVVAESRAQALDAAEAIVIDYEELPAVVDVREATAAGAPVLWPEAPDNVAAEARHGDAEATARAFASAAHVVRLELVNQRLVASPMEPRNTVAVFDRESGRLTLHASAQNPTALKQVLSQNILHLPPEKVRVVVRDIGGGFGMRAHLTPEDAVVAYAALKLACAVRWRADRSEDFQSAVQGRDQFSRAELALDAEGRILALRVDTLANAGAYLAPPTAPIPLALSPKVITGAYAIPVADIRVRLVLTNTVTVSAYRGAGRPEAIYLIERLMDAAAAKLGLDPAEIRRRNLIPASVMPYRNATGETYDTGNFVHFLERALEAADWNGFPARRAAAAARGRLLGRGLSYYIEWTGANALNETVEVIVEADGRVVVHSATQAMGQGLETAYTQLVAERLGIAPDRIAIVQGDTDLVQGFGSMGSRSLYIGGSAIVAGADRLIEHAKTLAADALEAAAADIEFADGRFTIVGTDRSIGLFELAARQAERRLAITMKNAVTGPSWPNGCHVCEVEIDPETGVARIVRYTTCDDVGRAINRTLVAGQLHGGIAQGVGQALYENAVYDRQTGQLVTGSYMDYTLPRADDLPSFAINIDESVPSTTNLLGAKGAGESGTVGSIPAVMNAVIDALRPLGIDHLDMPATPHAIWQAIRKAKHGGAARA